MNGVWIEVGSYKCQNDTHLKTVVASREDLTLPFEEKDELDHYPCKPIISMLSTATWRQGVKADNGSYWSRLKIKLTYTNIED